MVGAADEPNITTEPRAGNQVPPQDISSDRQGAGVGNDASPRREDQHRNP